MWNRASSLPGCVSNMPKTEHSPRLASRHSLEEAEKHLPEPQAAQLADTRKKLKETVMKLVIRNGINQKLIENALEYINFNLELLAAPAPEASVYGKTGAEVSSGGKRSMLDIRY